jgi:hypothetical protein
MKGEDFERLCKDEIRSGKHDDFIKANYGKFALITLQAKMKEKNTLRDSKTERNDNKSFDPLSINP